MGGEKHSPNRANPLHREIAGRLVESARVKETIARDLVPEIAQIVNLITAAYQKGGKVVLFGNGGSAADAQHIAGELVGRFLLKRQALPALALTANSSTITALANDDGYETVFRRQVEALVNVNDVVIGFSTSGSSPNVIEALKAARIKGARTVGLTGSQHDRMSAVADLVIAVPSESTPRIQEAHITIGHIVCELVEREMAGVG